MTWDQGLIPEPTVEAELLFRLSRNSVDEAGSEAINGLLELAIDWPAFLASVERNYVAPLVYKSLKSLEGGKVPRKVLETLRVRTRITAWKNEEFVTELVRLHDLFERKDIEILHYKGPSAAIELYGDVSGRTFNDMDFLVRRRDLDHALALLEEEGYRNAETFTQVEAELFVREQKEFLLSRGHIQLEPHFSLTARRYPFEIDYESLWDRSARLPYQDAQLRVLCPEDDLHVLAMVAAKGKWKRLQQLTDIAECIRTYPELDWNRIVSAVRETGSERILLLALYLSHALLGVQIPEDLRQRAQSSRSVRRLAQSIAISFSQPVSASRYLPASAHVFSPMLYAMRERWRDKLHYLIRTVSTPTQLHTRRMPLPRRLFFLYRILVPLHDYVIFPAVALARNVAPIGRGRSRQTLE